MKYQIIYFLLVTIMAIGATLFFIRSALDSLPVKKGIFVSVGRFKNKIITSKTLSFGRINIPILFYQAVRFTVLGTWFVLIILIKTLKGLPSFGMQIVALLVILAATTPKEKISRIKLPFFYISSFFKKINSEAANREIYRTISLLINLFTIKGENILGSNYILEEIIKTVKVTKPVYLQMLSLWNMNMKEEAAGYFSSAIGTKEARDLSGVFLKLDYISPKELKNQLTHYQNNIKTERTTARERVNERNGNLIYILAIISAVVVLLNFLVVVLTDVFTSYNLLSF